MEEFLLGSILDAIVSQVMLLVRGKSLQLFHEIPDEMKTLALYGDQIKLQVVLSDILFNVVNHTPFPKISPGLKIIQDGHEFIHFKMSHSSQGLPSNTLQDMFEEGNQWTTQEGLGLYMSRKMLSRMNGNVHYAREQNKCYFLFDLELRTRKERQRNLQAETSMLS
ncbi:Phytochrome E [Arachis hypogaea]|nr:Phytochrome E [Arachis hypogaea]